MKGIFTLEVCEVGNVVWLNFRVVMQNYYLHTYKIPPKGNGAIARGQHRRAGFWLKFHTGL